MTSELLVVRGADLVFFAVEYAGCSVGQDRLTATEDGAHLVVTFPPQSISEAKTEGADPELAWLSGPSQVVVELDVGASVPLNVAGVLTALTTRPLRTAASSIELPYGLQLAPRSADGAPLVASAPVGAVTPADPTAPDGTTAAGLWELVLADADATGRAVVADVVGAPARPDDAGSVIPLDNGERATIDTAGLPIAVDRLRLSALGGSLSATLTTDWMAWEHRTALGRDQHVRFQQDGVLFPFGHHASKIETVERVVDDQGRAFLRRRTELLISQPLLSYPENGTATSRAFPFHEAEIVGGSVSGVVTAELRTWPRPEALLGALSEELQAKQQQLNDQLQWFQDTYPQDVPTTVEALIASASYAGWGGEDVNTVVNDRYAAYTFENEIKDVKDAAWGTYGPGAPPTGTGTDGTDGTGTDGTDGPGTDGPVFLPPFPNAPPPPNSPWDYDSDGWLLADDYAYVHYRRERIAELDAEIAGALARLQPIADFLATFAPTAGELGNYPAWITRMAGLNPPVQGAPEFVALSNEVAALSNPQAEPTLVSTINDPSGTEHQFLVRLGGRLGDVTVTTPLYFVHAFTVPEHSTTDYYFPGYQSLQDPDAYAGLVLSHLPVPAVSVDLVRRPRTGAPTPTTDIQELHSVTITGQGPPSAMWPKLERFELALPEVRALVPGLDKLATGSLTSGLVDNGDPSVPVELSPAVDVSFAGHAERGGGLVDPSFRADRISADHGPVDARALAGQGEAALQALSNMKLFGIGLHQLLDGFQGTPKILQTIADGVPRGVTMTWDPPPRLRSVDPFVARARGDDHDTTTVVLRAEASLEKVAARCEISAFSLQIPSSSSPVVKAFFSGLTFEAVAGHQPTVRVDDFDVELGGALSVVKELADDLDLGGSKPHLAVTDQGITATYTIALPEAGGGAFLISNITVGIAVVVPFRAGTPSLTLDFGRPEAPFLVRVPPFGGTGYLGLTVDGKGLERVSGALEFGGSVGVDFKIVKAEAHVMVGVRVDYSGTVVVAGFLHIGGSLRLLGLVTVSVDLRVELAYDSGRDVLYGHATLVITIDLTLYSDSVELDSGEWEFAGGSHQRPPELQPDTAGTGWAQQQKAYAPAGGSS